MVESTVKTVHRKAIIRSQQDQKKKTLDYYHNK